MKMMTEEEFIRQAKLDWEDQPHIVILTIEDALEGCYMNGDYDDIGGEAEAPTGHYYRIEHWIVVTDDQGNKAVTAYPNVEEAEKALELLDRDYSLWLGDQEGV